VKYELWKYTLCIFRNILDGIYGIFQHIKAVSTGTCRWKRNTQLVCVCGPLMPASPPEMTCVFLFVGTAVVAWCVICMHEILIFVGCLSYWRAGDDGGASWGKLSGSLMIPFKLRRHNSRWLVFYLFCSDNNVVQRLVSRGLKAWPSVSFSCMCLNASCLSRYWALLQSSFDEELMSCRCWSSGF
jgi:hypothetical protein